MPFWINILVGLLAFVIAALGGKALLPWLHKLKFGQPIKVNFGPSWHANKQGTPTMGGILFIVGSIVATGVGYVLYRLFGMTDFVSPFSDREALRVLSCLLFCLLFGVIGFIDDFAKVAKKQNEGLRSFCRWWLRCCGWRQCTGWATVTPPSGWDSPPSTSSGSTIR